MTWFVPEESMPSSLVTRAQQWADVPSVSSLILLFSLDVSNGRNCTAKLCTVPLTGLPEVGSACSSPKGSPSTRCLFAAHSRNLELRDADSKRVAYVNAWRKICRATTRTREKVCHTVTVRLTKPIPILTYLAHRSLLWTTNLLWSYKTCVGLGWHFTFNNLNPFLLLSIVIIPKCQGNDIFGITESYPFWRLTPWYVVVISKH